MQSVDVNVDTIAFGGKDEERWRAQCHASLRMRHVLHILPTRHLVKPVDLQGTQSTNRVGVENCDLSSCHTQPPE